MRSTCSQIKVGLPDLTFPHHPTKPCFRVSMGWFSPFPWLSQFPRLSLYFFGVFDPSLTRYQVFLLFILVAPILPSCHLCIAPHRNSPSFQDLFLSASIPSKFCDLQNASCPFGTQFEVPWAPCHSSIQYASHLVYYRATWPHVSSTRKLFPTFWLYPVAAAA